MKASTTKLLGCNSPENMYKTTITESIFFLSKETLKARDILGQANLTPGCQTNQCSEIDKMIALTHDSFIIKSILLRTVFFG